MELKTKGLQYLLMILAAAAVFMDYLDTSIVTIALPTIAEDFGASSSFSSWVLISYLLTLGGTLLLFGKIADRTGRYKLIFTTGFGLFTIASVFCSLSSTMTILVIFRFLQGVAAALMVSTATSIINLHLPPKMQALGTGVIATGGGIALAAGPAVGGLLTEFLSWHWIFIINIPIGILGVIGALLLIPKDVKNGKSRENFDCLGAVLLILTLTSLLSGLEFGAENGWPLYSIVLTVLGPILGFFFIRRELKHRNPILSAKLLLNRTVMFASLSTLLVTLVYIGLLYVLPFYLDGVGFTTAESGFIMLIPPICLAIIGIPTGALMAKFSCMKLCNYATVILTIGLAVLALGIFMNMLPLILASLVITGIGNGLNEGPSIRRITVHSPDDLQGSAGGLVFTVMNIGCVVGVALYSVSATIGSGSTTFTSVGIALSCAVAVVFSVFSYLTSKLAKDTIRS